MNKRRLSPFRPAPRGAGPGPGPGPAVPGRLALAVIVSAQLMSGLDSTVVTVALPRLGADLRAAPAGLAWVINAYTLSYGGLLLLGGRIGDLAGRRRTFVAGIGLFTVASLACGLAPSAGWLVAARAVQGAGAAAAGPNAVALIATTFSGPARTRALAVLSAAASLSLTAGLLLGGLLSDASWRWVFAINLPIGAAIVVLAPRVVVGTAPHPGRLDLPGALLGTAGVGAVVGALLDGAAGGWGRRRLLRLGAGAVLLALLAGVERRAPFPLVPPALLADPRRRAAYLVTLLVPAAMFGTFFYLTQYFQQRLGLRPVVAGLAFLPLAVTMLVTVRAVPRLLSRRGPVPLVIAGCLAAAAGMLWLSRVSATTGYATGIALPMVVIGVGIGTAFVPLSVIILDGVPPSSAGAAGALMQALQMVGATVGLACLVTLYAARTRAAGAVPAVLSLDGASAAFLLAAGLAGVAAGVGALGLRRPVPRPAPEGQVAMSTKRE